VDPDIFKEILMLSVSLITTSAVGIMGYILKKQWEEHSANMAAIREAIEHCHTRNDVQDRFMSYQMNTHFDSSAIASGKMQMPSVAHDRP
jgi:hypothetical protein